MGHSGIEIDHRGLTSETLRRFPNIYAPKGPAHVDPLEAESIDMIEHGLSNSIALLYQIGDERGSENSCNDVYAFRT